jgi:hypothetical protein
MDEKHSVKDKDINKNKDNAGNAGGGFGSTGKEAEGSQAQGMGKERGGSNADRERSNIGKPGQAGQQQSGGAQVEYGQKERTSDVGKGGRENRPSNRPSRQGAAGTGSATEEE